MSKNVDLNFGWKGGSGVQTNFTNGSPNPENLYSHGFEEENEYISEIKEVQMLTLIFGEKEVKQNWNKIFPDPKNLYIVMVL